MGARPAITSFTSPRAWAYSLLGIDHYLRAFQGDSTVEVLRADMANRLLTLFQRSSHKEWPWFEDRVTYCNARMSQALIVSGSRMNRADMISAGLRSLEWLVSLQLSGHSEFAPIGCNGFFPRGGSAATFDQQPVEACTIASACLDAYKVTRNDQWKRHAARAFDWFLGQNDLQQWLYDPSTGGCRDGLHADRTNRNQGAEATLSFLMTLCELRAAHQPDAVVARTLQATS
jgi:hypothetical protein